MGAEDRFWHEDPLPVPSTPIYRAINVGDKVSYRGLKRKQITGKVRGLLSGGQLAQVDGHPQPFPVQVVLVSRLRRIPAPGRDMR